MSKEYIAPYSIYDKSTHQWFTPDEEKGKEYNKEKEAFRKQKQRLGQCRCPHKKAYLCNMICEDCEFRINSDLSLDDLHGNGYDETEVTLKELLVVSGASVEDQVIFRDLLSRVIPLLYKNVKGSKEIIELWAVDPDMTGRAMAKVLGRNQTTVAKTIRRIRAVVIEEYGSLYK